MSRDLYMAIIRRRLAAEVGRVDKHAPFRVALSYPSPYHTGMSSLGFQQIYRSVQAEPGMAADRAFLPDDDDDARTVAVTYEQLRPIGDYPVIAFSVAYELQLAGVIRMLETA